MTTMYGKPCAPSEPLFWLWQNILCDTKPGARVPDRDQRLINVLATIEDAVYAWSSVQ
jgi:hypothetical protein